MPLLCNASFKEFGSLVCLWNDVKLRKKQLEVRSTSCDLVTWPLGSSDHLFSEMCQIVGWTAMANLAALRAAVFSLSGKNRTGGLKSPPPPACARVKTSKHNVRIILGHPIVRLCWIRERCLPPRCSTHQWQLTSFVLERGCWTLDDITHTQTHIHSTASFSGTSLIYLIESRAIETSGFRTSDGSSITFIKMRGCLGHQIVQWPSVAMVHTKVRLFYPLVHAQWPMEKWNLVHKIRITGTPELQVNKTQECVAHAPFMDKTPI